MPLNLNIVEQSIVPPFRQIINQIEESIRNGSLKSGEMLPSMSEMAESLGLSKETVKKSYLILRDRRCHQFHQRCRLFHSVPGFEPEEARHAAF